MSPNQSRILRFCLAYPGWHNVATSERRAWQSMADNGWLVSDGPRFRINTRDASAALHALQELLENMESPRSRKATLAWDNARRVVLKEAGR